MNITLCVSQGLADVDHGHTREVLSVILSEETMTPTDFF